MSIDRARPPRHVLPLALTPVVEGDLSTYFEGLANPTRLQIVERLAQVKEARVSDVALLLGISQPRMSWHLRLLRRAGIVLTRREGREVFCRLDRDSIADSISSFTDLLAPGGRPAATEPLPESAPAESVNPTRAHPARERSLPEVI
ncbi:MAG: metalloregulator ArsR/SmtB family transcription factor [Candidatus Dormiibacterota bacterium]